MVNQSSSPALMIPASVVYMALPVIFCAPAFAVPSGMLSCAPVSLAAPVAPPAEKIKDKSDKDKTATPTTTRTAPGAGLPAPLVALLRSGVDGPFLANEVFSEAPSQPWPPSLRKPPPQNGTPLHAGASSALWINSTALSDVAITGVGASARKSYTTQALALNAFNQALTWGGVSVV
ncbi:hypothetical protein B0H13DRAFT_1866210 [Mycena leptocephala]|nr:hypothetical protein B0H13DRAFT_1866210 [Mycena leptocephala]